MAAAFANWLSGTVQPPPRQIRARSPPTATSPVDRHQHQPLRWKGGRRAGVQDVAEGEEEDDQQARDQPGSDDVTGEEPSRPRTRPARRRPRAPAASTSGRARADRRRSRRTGRAPGRRPAAPCGSGTPSSFDADARKSSLPRGHEHDRHLHAESAHLPRARIGRRARSRPPCVRTLERLVITSQRRSGGSSVERGADPRGDRHRAGLGSAASSSRAAPCPHGVAMTWSPGLRGTGDPGAGGSPSPADGHPCTPIDNCQGDEDSHRPDGGRARRTTGRMADQSHAGEDGDEGERHDEVAPRGASAGTRRRGSSRRSERE